MQMPANLALLAEESLQRVGEQQVLHFEGEVFSNRHLLDQARRMQRRFSELGVGKDKIVGLFMINDPLVYPVFQGIFRAGGAAVPVMFQATAPELRFVLEDTSAIGVVTDSAGLETVRSAVAGLESIRWILVRGGTTDTTRPVPEFALEELLQSDPMDSLPNIDIDDLSLLLYTSGTTGRPKGVMMSHRNLLGSAEAAHRAHELETWEGPRTGLSAMPMAHIFGIAIMNDLYLMPDRLIGQCISVQMRRFDPQMFLKMIGEYQATTMAAVPTMLAFLLHQPNLDQFNFDSLKEVVCGAAPLSPELAAAFSQRFGVLVRNIYGMTENAGIATAHRRSLPPKPGSAGKPYHNCELRIVDENDQPVPPGQLGEIVTRGPTTMKGYYNRPTETEQTLRGGWLHTGDIGYLDEDGYLFVVDRKKDMIIRGGENIYPAELEDVLYGHPAVAEAAIVGIPDPVMGENVIAFVVKKPGAEVTEEEILEHMGKQVTKFKLPQAIYFLQFLPKSGVGKVLRRVLRDEAVKLHP